jgi:hypothetical protein
VRVADVVEQRAVFLHFARTYGIVLQVRSEYGEKSSGPVAGGGGEKGVVPSRRVVSVARNGPFLGYRLVKEKSFLSTP